MSLKWRIPRVLNIRRKRGLLLIIISVVLLLLAYATIPFTAVYYIIGQCSSIKFCPCTLETKLLKLNLLSDTLPSVCGYDKCESEYLMKYHGNTNQSKIYLVPPIRHILWKSDLMSEYFLRQLKTWVTLHPDWTYVLWRDKDLDPFVKKYFPGKIWQKFNSLPKYGRLAIFRIDMVRYLILYQFGGVYADMDYSLFGKLTWYRQFPNVITREPEAHSGMIYGLNSYPLPVLANSAFMMSRPQSDFMKFCINKIINRCIWFEILDFAGPKGLSDILQSYQYQNPSLEAHIDFVLIPPSYIFYPYPNNSLSFVKSAENEKRIQFLRRHCSTVKIKDIAIRNFCKDVTNFNSITNSHYSIIATHDLNKIHPAYDAPANYEFITNLKSVKLSLPNLLFGNEFFRN